MRLSPDTMRSGRALREETCRAHRLERLRHGVPYRLRSRPSAGEKPLGAGNTGDHQPKSRGWQRQAVLGRAAAAAQRTERLVRAVRREQQAKPVQQREQTPFHSRENLFARPLTQWTRATLSRWPRLPRFRPASSFRSSRGSRESARSTRLRSRNVLHHSLADRSSATRRYSHWIWPSA